jgi:hypothetical protein
MCRSCSLGIAHKKNMTVKMSEIYSEMGGGLQVQHVNMYSPLQYQKLKLLKSWGEGI